jgi:hypothetical protein
MSNKGGTHKRVHTICFYFYEIQELAKLIDGHRIRTVFTPGVWIINFE